MVLFLQKFPAFLENILLPVVVRDYCRNRNQSKTKTKKVEIAKEQTRYEPPPLPKGQDAAHFSLLFWLCSDTMTELRALISLLFWLYSLTGTELRAYTFLYFSDSFLTPGPSSLWLFFRVFQVPKGDQKIHKLIHKFFLGSSRIDVLSCVPWLSFIWYSSCNWELGEGGWVLGFVLVHSLSYSSSYEKFYSLFARTWVLSSCNLFFFPSFVECFVVFSWLAGFHQ